MAIRIAPPPLATHFNYSKICGRQFLDRPGIFPDSAPATAPTIVAGRRRPVDGRRRS
jgi:hypothetical protein